MTLTSFVSLRVDTIGDCDDPNWGKQSTQNKKKHNLITPQLPLISRHETIGSKNNNYILGFQCFRFVVFKFIELNLKVKAALPLTVATTTVNQIELHSTQVTPRLNE